MYIAPSLHLLPTPSSITRRRRNPPPASITRIEDVTKTKRKVWRFRYKIDIKLFVES